MSNKRERSVKIQKHIQSSNHLTKHKYQGIGDHELTLAQDLPPPVSNFAPEKDPIEQKNQVNQSGQNQSDQTGQNFFMRFKKFYNNLSKRAKIAFIVGLSLLFIGIVLAIVLPIVLSIQLKQGVKIVPIEYKGAQMFLHSQHRKKGNHTCKLMATNGRKTQSIDSRLESVTRVLQRTQNYTTYEFVINTMAIFEQFQNKKIHKNPNSNWLEQYNKSPQEYLDKLLAVIEERFMKKQGQEETQLNDNFPIIKVSRELYADVKFDQTDSTFKLVKFDSLTPKPPAPPKEQKSQDKKDKNLKKQEPKAQPQAQAQPQPQPEQKAQTAEKPKQQAAQPQAQPQQKPQQNKWKPQNKGDWMQRIILNSLRHIKKIAKTNIDILQKKSKQLQAYQQNFIQQNQIKVDWQEVLVKNCKSIATQLFRCEISAINKLVQEMTPEKIKTAQEEYMLTNALKIVFKKQVEKIE